MNTCIASLGTYCKITYQFRNYYRCETKIKNENDYDIGINSYPIDWTICSLDGLKLLFSKDFKLENVLKKHKNSIFNTPQDLYTNIIFYHERSVEEARNRFIHTYKNYENLKKFDRIIFVRWSRHVDVQKDCDHWYNGARAPYKLTNYYKDPDQELLDILINFFENKNIKIINVKSKFDLEGMKFKNITDDLIYCVLGESLEKSKDFMKGDEVAWQNFFKQIELKYKNS